ncbi:MAG: AbrB/MazE/SpoVT family DNA-binding domain-containing protein [Desulfobacterales bacterium]
MTKGKVFPKGQVVIPAELRKKYNIQIGDPVDLVLSAEGILMKPVLKPHTRESMAEKLFGIFSMHKKIQDDLSKKDILQATKEGFNSTRSQKNPYRNPFLH